MLTLLLMFFLRDPPFATAGERKPDPMDTGSHIAWLLFYSQGKQSINSPASLHYLHNPPRPFRCACQPAHCTKSHGLTNCSIYLLVHFKKGSHLGLEFYIYLHYLKHPREQENSHPKLILQPEGEGMARRWVTYGRLSSCSPPVC